MRDQKMFHEAYPYGFSRRGVGLSIITQTPHGAHGATHLISPPESANGHRPTSCYDDPFQHTPVSSYHPNTPITFPVADSYDIEPSDNLKLNIQALELDSKCPMPTPSPGDYAPGQNYGNLDVCSSPAWQSPLSNTLFDQKPPQEASFYEDSSKLMSNSQDWGSSHMSSFSTVDCAPETLHSQYQRNSFFMLPSQDTSSSFLHEADSSTFDSSNLYIAPVQAMNNPERDITSFMSVDAGWSQIQSPVHASEVLHSSSPSENYPPTPLFEHPMPTQVHYMHSPSSDVPRRTRSTNLDRPKKRKQLKRQRGCQTMERLTATGVAVEVSMDKRTQVHVQSGSVSERKMHECPICSTKFERSEHCKRHMGMHSGEHPFHCYIAGTGKNQCAVGKKKDGKQNRKDNSRSHHWTHVKAWLVEHDPLVKERSRLLGKKNKGRNKQISPQDMLALVRGRDDKHTQDTVLNFLNMEAGKDFNVHIHWDHPDCPVLACRGLENGCDMCRKKSKTKTSKL